MNILIVEDDTAIREGVAEFLKENEYEDFCAEDGEKALEILKSKEIPYHGEEQSVVMTVPPMSTTFFEVNRSIKKGKKNKSGSAAEE